MHDPDTPLTPDAARRQKMSWAENAKRVLREATFTVVRVPERNRAEFDAAELEEGRSRLSFAVFLGLIVYLAYAPLILLAFPDLGNLDVSVRIGAGLPLLLATLYVIRRTRSYLIQQCAAALSAILYSFWTCLIPSLSSAPESELLLAANAVIIIYVIVMMRTWVWLGTTVSAIIMLIQVVVTRQIGMFPAKTHLIWFAMNLSVAVTGLYALANLNNERRRSFVLAVRDRERLKEMDAQNRALDKLSETDAQTGLMNRRGLDRFVAEHAEEGKAKLTACLFLDVDHFKPFNDNYGHPAGDLVLARIARTLQATCLSSDLVCRYGGEEFVVLRTFDARPNSWDLQDWAHTVRRKVEQMGLVHEYSPTGIVTVSIGVAALGRGQPIHSVITAADNALYVAKEGGRNRVVDYADIAEAEEDEMVSNVYVFPS